MDSDCQLQNTFSCSNYRRGGRCINLDSIIATGQLSSGIGWALRWGGGGGGGGGESGTAQERYTPVMQEAKGAFSGRDELGLCFS